MARRFSGIALAAMLLACNGDVPHDLATELGAVCAGANRDLDAVDAPSPDASPDELAAFFRATASANRTAAARVAGLEAPPELLDDRDALVDAISDVAASLDAAAEAVADDDEEALGKARDELLAARERFDDRAVRLGAAGCLRSRSPSPGI